VQPLWAGLKSEYTRWFLHKPPNPIVARDKTLLAQFKKAITEAARTHGYVAWLGAGESRACSTGPRV
jgi:hypothetical protein